ncbi:sulfotransferase [Promicromonospora kroppenstedtii]|uniref:sulfotransferase n=1 Tax=Promicromonospora kroppenstedtii TaxID=440482 RepID=UPI0004B162EA|nr:sulfotransferase [Promicromonospora kroppenstedtii]
MLTVRGTGTQLARRFGTALEKHAGLRVTRVPRDHGGVRQGDAQSGARQGGTPSGGTSRPGRGRIRPPADPAADRLLVAPVFVLSSPRAGSTLLRVVLDSHSQVHAPIETHVRRLSVDFTTRLTQEAMYALGHNVADVEHILWDRVLHRELLRSGKQVVVEKTPSNVFVADRLAVCWPDARFIFLLRHPASIARSWHDADPARRPMNRAVMHTLKYMTALEDVRHRLPGLTVRYEDVTADPATEFHRICDFLGLPWEPGMVSYGDHEHGEVRKGLGDWRDKIRTGSIQAGRTLPDPDEIPRELRTMSEYWGYAPASAASD